MPIYEQIYRSWHGRRGSGRPAWWVIGKTGIKLLWKRSTMLLLGLSLVPFFVRVAHIYMVTRFDTEMEIIGASESFAIDAGFFAGFMRGQMFFIVLMMILAGAGLIANDRKYNALPLYFSKPVGFLDYMAGKMVTVAFYGALITFVPALLLFIIEVMVSRDASFLRVFFWVPFAIMGYSLVMLGVVCSIVLAFSAASRGTRTAAIFFFVLMTFPDVIRRVLSRVPNIDLISLTHVLRAAGGIFFPGEDGAGGTALGIPVLVTATALSWLILWRKVRPTEVIK